MLLIVNTRSRTVIWGSSVKNGHIMPGKHEHIMPGKHEHEQLWIQQ